MRILYLDLDALTPSHLGCYGYSRDTSPNLDALAARGTRCTNVYTSDAPCLPSRTAFYSGRFGIQTGVVNHGGRASQPRVTNRREFRDHFDNHGLAGQLQKAGYHTAMISPFGQRHAAWHFYAGFPEIYNTGKCGREVVEEVMPAVEDWLGRKAASDDWYLHVNFWDIHTPYRAPASYGDPFADAPLPEWMDEAMLEKAIAAVGPHTALEPGMYGDGNQDDFPRETRRIDSMAAMKHWIDGYDTAIRYVDDQVGRILGMLADAGVLDDTLIIVSADHGENQGELNIFGEHATADQATCNIPMIVAGPGVAAGRVDDDLHYNVDFCPTLLQIIGHPPGTDDAGLDTAGVLDGQSYADRLLAAPTESAPARAELILSQLCHVCQRSVRYDDGDHRWLYIRTWHDGFHLFPREMLFDLAADPHEQHDLAPARPDIVREAVYRYARWHDTQMEKLTRIHAPDVAEDPLWTVMREGGPFHARADGSSRQPADFDGYLQRLRDTGRAAGADRLAATRGRPDR